MLTELCTESLVGVVERRFVISKSCFKRYICRVAYKLERKTKLLEGPGNLIKTFRPFGLRQLKFFFLIEDKLKI